MQGCEEFNTENTDRASEVDYIELWFNIIQENLASCNNNVFHHVTCVTYNHRNMAPFSYIENF